MIYRSIFHRFMNVHKNMQGGKFFAQKMLKTSLNPKRRIPLHSKSADGDVGAPRGRNFQRGVTALLNFFFGGNIRKVRIHRKEVLLWMVRGLSERSSRKMQNHHYYAFQRQHCLRLYFQVAWQLQDSSQHSWLWSMDFPLKWWCYQWLKKEHHSHCPHHEETYYNLQMNYFQWW